MTSDNARADLAAIADGLTDDLYRDAIWLRREIGRTTVSTGKWPIMRAGDAVPRGKVDVSRLPSRLRRV